MQKLNSNPKGETKIEEEEVDREPGPASKKHTPVPREPYKPPKSVHEMKVNDDYKEDNVRPFDFQDEIDRIREENESLKEQISNLETRMATFEINIKDVNHNSKELRNYVDSSVKYTIELQKLELAPRKVAKYINKVHNIKKDVTNLKNARPCGSPTNDSFAEKLARSKLIEQELENLRNLLGTLAANDQKTVEEQTKLFKSNGWNHPKFH
ncbi:hypothetical protein M9Y10_008465 [Tritrichomonas musculus]|uniref:Uncharacterized protein n=1 Tax=Tritrichomonas musculus TaxID=1915356 RepID=A0ABR2IYG1_9EUKA